MHGDLLFQLVNTAAGLDASLNKFQDLLVSTELLVVLCHASDFQVLEVFFDFIMIDVVVFKVPDHVQFIMHNDRFIELDPLENTHQLLVLNALEAVDVLVHLEDLAKWAVPPALNLDRILNLRVLVNF